MLERFLFSKVEVWIIIAIVILSIPAVMLYGWMVQHKASGGERGGKFGDLLLAAAKFPESVGKLLVDPNVLQPQRIEFSQFAGLKWYQEFQDNGTLLVSSYSEEHEVTTAFLYDLRTQQVLHEWVPPVEEIRARTSFKTRQNVKQNYRTQHPLLLENGDIVFTSGDGPLARITACGELVWAINRQFHHSIERSRDGQLFVPIVVTAPEGPASAAPEDDLVSPIRDDGFAQVSMEGEILREWSVKEILERHGYLGLLYGVGPYEKDRVHLNDVEPIWQDDDYVQAGDVVLSSRHLSTVLLYRAATDEIVWLKTGPWLNQHDVDYQGNGVFTIFGNDSVRGEASRESLRGYSTIWQYDQKTGQAKEYLPLEHVDIFAWAQGVHRVLDNGDAFIEASNLLHRVSADGLRWSYAKGIGEGQIGALHWSRYLTAEQASFPWLRDLHCSELRR